MFLTCSKFSDFQIFYFQFFRFFIKKKKQLSWKKYIELKKIYIYIYIYWVFFFFNFNMKIILARILSKMWFEHSFTSKTNFCGLSDFSWFCDRQQQQQHLKNNHEFPLIWNQMKSFNLLFCDRQITNKQHLQKQL